MRLFAAIVVLFFGLSSAFGQALIQAGPWTPGHAPGYSGTRGAIPLVQDSGPAGGAGPGLSEGLYIQGPGGGTGPYGTNWCDYDAPITSASYHYLCLSPNASGGGTLAYGAVGTAPQELLSFYINGIKYNFPIALSGILGPATTVVGDVACWANTQGTLVADCQAPILYANHAALIAATTMHTANTIGQSGYTATGYGAAFYDWNAGSYCPGGTSISPTTADGIACILPISQLSSTAGRYLLRPTGGVLDVQQIGMAPDGVTDNSAFTTTWMNTIAPSPTLYSGYASRFSPAVGQNAAYYYFANPIDVSRGGTVSCGGTPPTNTSGGGVTLLIAAGQDGFINDASTTSPDLHNGPMEIDNCLIRSLGFSFVGATLTVGSGTITNATLPAIGFQTPSWGPGDGVIAAIAVNRPIDATTLTAATTGANTITASGGFPITAVGMVALDTAAAAFGFYGGTMVVSCAPNGCGLAGNTTLTLSTNVTTAGAADKVRFVNPDFQLLPTGAYIDSCSPCTGAATLTLHPGFEPTWMPSVDVAVLYQLPAALAYTIVTSSGSPTATVTAGPRNLVQGDMLWAPGVPFGSIVRGHSGSIPSESITFTNIALASNVNATATGTVSAWTIPSCRVRRSQSTASGVSCVGFPIGLKEACTSTVPDLFNCTITHDYNNWYSNSLIGRLMSGGNTGGSLSVGEEFATNYIFDMIDAGQVGSTYTNLNSNSAEGSSSLFTVAFNTANSNFSLMTGGYFGLQVNQPLPLPIVSAQAQWGVPTTPSGFGSPTLIVNPSSGFQSTTQNLGVSVILGQSWTGRPVFYPFVTSTYFRTGMSSNQDSAGRVVLSGGTGTYTIQNVSGTPNCGCWSTNPSNSCSVSEAPTTLTFTGTGSDTVKYICIGRN